MVIEGLSFGKTLILPEFERDAPARAAACFAAVPRLDHIAIWDKGDLGGGIGGHGGIGYAIPSEAKFFLKRDQADTWFLCLEDVDEDRAAAACFRFSFAHDALAHRLSAMYGIDGSLSVLSFHRSGAASLILHAEFLTRLGNFDRRIVAPRIHPVFAVEPTAHERMHWASVIWSDLELLRSSARLLIS